MSWHEALGISKEEWDAKVEESILETRRRSMHEVDALLAADWKFELPEIVNRREGEPEHMGTEPWQWYWRSPPKRKNSKGRKYLSTTQAFNALNRLRQGQKDAGKPQGGQSQS